MKSLVEYISESFESNVSKCKTFGEFFCLYNGVDSIDEYEEDNFNMSDAAFLFNKDGMSFDEFVEWVKSVKDEPISKPIVKNNNVTFKIGNETFDLDFVEY